MSRTKWYAKPIVIASEAWQSRRMARLKAWKFVSILIALALVLSLGIVAVPMAGTVEAATINVPGDYGTIQTAIDAASPGDIIIVHTGTYNEEINITTSNISLLGEDRETTTIDAGGVRWGAIDVTGASHITVSGFTVHNHGGGIQRKGINIVAVFGGDSCQYITVEDCKIYADEDGIRMHNYGDAGFSTFRNNIIESGWNGIHLEYTSQNTVTQNTISSATGWAGINFGIRANDNTVQYNEITGCKYGMNLVASQGGTSGNVICNNEITNNERGIWWQRNPGNTIEYNNIFNNTYNLYAGSYFTSEDPAPVENNWWGQDPPDASKFYGPVDYTPWSTSPNSTSPPPTEVWVDDDWTSQADVDLFDPNLIWQYDAFDTIQDGIDNVAGSTVHVAAGTYIDDENGDGDDLDANEGGLVADIYKSNLTLQSTDGPAVTIIKSRGTEGDGAIRIRGADDGTPTTGVTVDGFTVYNTGTANSGAGIFIGAWFAGDMGHPASDNTVKNCIIGSATDQSLSPTNGVYLWGTTGNLIQGNIIHQPRNEPNDFGNGIILWGGMPDQHAPSPNNQVLDNEIYDSDRFGVFIGAATQQNFDNMIVRGNTITGSSGAPGIGLWNILGCDTIHINFNNIYDNVMGIWVADCDAAIDATCNWWGDASGPHNADSNPTGTGDAVSDNVDYMPWYATSTTTPDREWVEVTFSPDVRAYSDTIQGGIDAAQAGDTINVAAGTYNETVKLKSTTATGISIVGQNKTTTFITEGICFEASYSGLKVQNFTISGNGFLDTETYEATVACSWTAGHVPVTNLEFSDCVFDGEGYDDKKGGRCGVLIKKLGGVVKFENNEFENYHGWATLYVNEHGQSVTSYTFNNNYIHDNWGSCALYGDSSDPTDTVTVTGNTLNNNGNLLASSWAALEINEADSVTVSSNTITNTQAGSWGEGEALQFWHITTLNVTGNTIANNYQGIYFAGPAPWAGDVSGAHIHFNNIYSNTQFGIEVETNNTGMVDATCNWWGDASGPSSGVTDPVTGTLADGTGDAVSDNVHFDPWLKAPSPYPLFAMASFTIDHAKIDFKKKVDDDKVRVSGKLELDLVCGDGVDISEDVIVTVGPLTETIMMVEKGKKGEKWEYKRPKGDGGNIKHMTIDWKNGKFDIRMDKADLSEVPNPVTISIQIGDDLGEETITMNEKKHHWDYKVK